MAAVVVEPKAGESQFRAFADRVAGAIDMLVGQLRNVNHAFDLAVEEDIDMAVSRVADRTVYHVTRAMRALEAGERPESEL